MSSRLRTATEPPLVVTTGKGYSADFLRPVGSTGCQLDAILLQALASYQLEEELVSRRLRLGIARLVDLYKATTSMHADLKDRLSEPDASGDSLRDDLEKFVFSLKGLKKSWSIFLYSPSPLLSNLENYHQESRKKATTTNDSALLLM